MTQRTTQGPQAAEHVVAYTNHVDPREGYVLRSMSTTDWDVRNPSLGVTPYHVYLYPSWKRGSAWWTPYFSEAAIYATPQEAASEAARLGLERAQVAPRASLLFPTYWEVEDMNGAYRNQKKHGGVIRPLSDWERTNPTIRDRASRGDYP